MPLSHMLGFQSYGSELVFLSHSLCNCMSNSQAEPNTNTVSQILWVSLSCHALKSIRSTGYECRSYFVELTCILSLLKYKGEPRLQEVACLYWHQHSSSTRMKRARSLKCWEVQNNLLICHFDLLIKSL